MEKEVKMLQNVLNVKVEVLLKNLFNSALACTLKVSKSALTVKELD